MTSEQETFHVDVGCYSPPPTTDATIIGTNGAQPQGAYAGLDPLWVQPTGHRCNGTSFNVPLGLNTIPTQIELVSKELNHFGVIADLFRQIGGHSSRFVLFCSF